MVDKMKYKLELKGNIFK